MEKYFLHGNLTAKPGQEEKLVEILLQASKRVKDSKGCRFYTISIDPNIKENIWVTEIWDSKADHNNSLKDEKTRELILMAMPLLNRMPETGQELVTLGGIGF